MVAFNIRTLEGVAKHWSYNSLLRAKIGFEEVSLDPLTVQSRSQMVSDSSELLLMDREGHRGRWGG